MLPEELSADLCSLVEGADRPCLAVRMVLDAHGNKIGHRFARGLMRSPASLAYETVQDAMDGRATLDAELMERAVRPLYAAYHAAAAARERRQPLDLDLPERRIVLDEAGAVIDIRFRDRMDAHRLIEEFMILANVAAAETLEAARTPLIYRVHEEPAPERLDSLREIVEPLGLRLAKGQVLQTRHFNQLLAQARGTEAAETVGMSVLRAQTQAYYAPQNLGHFGLNLPRYAHFTSPIRRYADLIVHRALIRALKLGKDGLSGEEIARLQETAEHISMTERRSMEAERDTVDRYVAAYLSDRIGAEFRGRVAGVSRAGAFVKLDETGADGLVPISTLGSDYFRHDPERQTLTGDRTGRVIGLGQAVTVRLREAAPITGGLILEILSVEGARLTAPGRGGGRKAGRERIRKAKAARARRRG
jgi:ribonuclease R